MLPSALDQVPAAEMAEIEAEYLVQKWERDEQDALERLKEKRGATPRKR